MEDLKIPMTAAVRQLLKHNVSFRPLIFEYMEKGGTKYSSQTLGVPEHSIVKTLMMENEDKEPLVVLMHGDLQVSTKQLARVLNVKRIYPCAPETAERHSGYQVGGTSPFGMRKPMPLYVEKSILDLEMLYINGGKRGFLVEISPADLKRVLNPVPVEVGTKSSS